MINKDTEKTRFTWGVQSLPWLILTDSRHLVIDAGFGLNDLDDKIKAANEWTRICSVNVNRNTLQCVLVLWETWLVRPILFRGWSCCTAFRLLHSGSFSCFPGGGSGCRFSSAVFSGQLQLTTGIGDFQFVSSHFNYVNQIYQPNPCHAKYTYADDALNQGGLLHLPFISRAKAVISILVAGLKRVRWGSSRLDQRTTVFLHSPYRFATSTKLSCSCALIANTFFLKSIE